MPSAGQWGPSGPQQPVHFCAHCDPRPRQHCRADGVGNGGKECLKMRNPSGIAGRRDQRHKNAEGGCWVRQEMNTLWRSGILLREMCRMSQREWRGCVFWHWKCIVCSVLMKCASAALVLFSGWGSLLQFLCHLSFLHPTKLKFSNLMGQWDKKENQMTMTCGPNVNSRFSSLQYIFKS